MAIEVQDEQDLSFTLSKLEEGYRKSGLEINLDKMKYIWQNHRAVMDLEKLHFLG